MPDSRKKLYDALSSDYDLGTFDEFNAKMDDQDSRKKLYESVSAEVDLGSFDDFESKVSVKKKEPTTPTFGQDVSQKLGLKSSAPFVQSTGQKSPLKTAATTTPSVSTKPKTNGDYLTDINNLYKEKLSASQERVNTKRELLNLQPQIESVYGEIEALNAIYNDPNTPLQERNKAAEQANLLISEAEPIKQQYDLLGAKYNELIGKDRDTLTKLKKVDSERQLQLQKEFSIGKDLLEKTGKGFVDAAAGVAGIFNTLGLSGDTEGGEDYDQEEARQQTRQNIDKIRDFGNSLVTQETPKEWQSVFDGKFSPKKLAYITSQAVSSTIPTVAAGLFTGIGGINAFTGANVAGSSFAGTALIGAGMGFNESKDILKEAGLNDSQAEWASLGLSIPLGILEEYGAGDVVKILSSPTIKKKVAADLVKRIAGKEITKDLLFNESKKSLGKVIADNAGAILTTGVKEAGTEAGQGTLQEIAKQTAEEYTGVNPDDQIPFDEYIKGFAKQRGEEMVGGFLGGTTLQGAGQTIQSTLSGFKPNFAPSVYAQVKEFTDPERLQEFQEDLQSDVEQGIVTPEQADEAMQNVQAIIEADALIPSTIKDNDIRTNAVNLIIEKNRISAEVEGKDKSLVTPQSERIKQIDEQLVAISKGEPIVEAEEQIDDSEISNEVINAEVPTTIEEETIETPSGETITDTIVSDGSATPTAVETEEVIEQPVAEVKEQPEVIKERSEIIENKGIEPIKEQKLETKKRELPKALSSVEETAKALEGKDVSINIKTTLKDINHFTDNENFDFDKDRGAWFTTDKSGYVRRPNAKTKITRYIDENALKLATEKQVFLAGEGDFDKGLKALEKQGYDGAKTKNNNSTEYYIFDVNKTKNRQELISEAYHKAKADGSNPELVKAVEELLGVPTVSETTTTETEVTPTETKEVVSETVSEKPNSEVQILDTERKIAQLEKELKKAPVRPSKGVASQKQIRIQIKNYNEQLRELKGLPPKKKPTDSVLRINLRKFGTEVNEANLPHEERVVLEAMGRLDASDIDIASLDGNASLRMQNVLKTKGGDSIDRIVTDYISENNLSEDMAQDLRDAIIVFVNKGDAYKWMDSIREREKQTDPDAVREDEYYNYGYDMAIEMDMTDEEISELEQELGQLTDLSQEEYENIRNQFAEESDTRAGKGVDKTQSTTDSGKEKQGEKSITASERKEILGAKVDEVAEMLKDILSGPNKDVKKSSIIDQDKVIDVVASAVKMLINAGIDINEAIRQVREKLEQKFDTSAVDDNSIKVAIAKSDLQDYLKEKGVSSYRNAVFIVNKYLREAPEKSVITQEELEQALENKEKGEIRDDYVPPTKNKTDEAPKSNKPKRRFTEQFAKEYPQLAPALSEDVVSYTELPNELTVDEANAIIDYLGEDEAIKAFGDFSNGMGEAVRMSIGQILIKRLEDNGEYDKAIDLLEDVTKRATDLGQGIQALSMFTLLSPQGQLRYAARTVNKKAELKAAIDKPRTDKLKTSLLDANKAAIEEALGMPKIQSKVQKVETIEPKITIKSADYGSKNKLVSKTKYEQLKKQLKGKLFSNIPPEIIEIGIYHLEAGARKFADFSEAIITEFGKKAKPYLKGMYTEAKNRLLKEGYDENEFSTDQDIIMAENEEKGRELIKKVELAIKSGNKKAYEKAISDLQNLGKETGLWGKYRDYAVNRLKSLKIGDIQKDVAQVPSLEDFTNALVQNIKEQVQETLPETERKKVITKPSIEIIADAFKNIEKYREVWDKTQAQIKEKFKGNEDALNALDAYFGDIMPKPFSAKKIKTAVAQELKEMKVSVAEIIKQHYTVYDYTQKTLVDRLVEKAGLSEVEAKELSTAVQAEFNRIATDKKQKALAKILSKGERKKPEIRGLEEDLIRLTNLGAFSDKKILEAWADKMGYPKLTEQNIKDINRLADAVQQAKEGFKKFRAIEDLLSYQANIKGVSPTDVGLAIWYANLLSGYQTQAVNLVANLANSALLYGNFVTQVIGNPKMASFMAKGFYNGIVRGMLEAKETLKTGYSPIRGKVEVPAVLERYNFKELKIGNIDVNPANYLKYVSRVMKAADVLVFEGDKEMRAYQLAARMAAANPNMLEPNQTILDKAAELAGVNDANLQDAIVQADLEYEQEVEDINEASMTEEARKKALKQAEIDRKRRVYEIIEEGRKEEIQRESIDFAARATYNYKPEGVLGWLASTVNSAKDSAARSAENADTKAGKIGAEAKKVLFNFIVPFTNIVANVANENLNYTPVGLLRRWSGRTSFTNYNSKELTDQEKTDLTYKAIMGTTMMVSLAMYFLMGDDEDDEFIEITANGTGDYTKNYQLKETGWQPYSIKVGGVWISYQNTPLMAALSTIGFMKDKQKYKNQSLTDEGIAIQVVSAVQQLGKAIFDMTFLQGLNTFMQSLFDEKGVNQDKLIGSLGRSTSALVIPALYNQSFKGAQNIFEIPSKNIRGTFIGPFVQNIPFARNMFYDQLNVLGEPVIPDTDKFISVSKDVKLFNLMADKGVFVTPPNEKKVKVEENGKERFATKEEFYKYSKVRGEFIKDRLNKNYDSLKNYSKKDFQIWLDKVEKAATAEAKVFIELKK
jgi:hypothetical protein